MHPTTHDHPLFAGAEPRLTARRFMTYVVLAGAAQTVFFTFNEAVAAKTLLASPAWITLLTMTMPLANFTSIWWARLLVGRDQRRIIMAAGIAMGLTMATAWVMTSIVHLVVMYLVCSLLIALATTAENRALQQHIPSTRIGRLFGAAGALRAVSAAVVAFAAGYTMQQFEGAYRHVYVVSGLIGALALWQLGSIRTGSNGRDAPEPLNAQLLLAPLSKVCALLARRRDYLRFEAAFMLYGFAFMMSLPVAPLYLVQKLGFDYAGFGTARGLVFSLALAAGVLLFGRLFDRSTPHRMAALAFLLLAFYPPALIAAERLPEGGRIAMAMAAFVIFGFGMGATLVVWSLSSLRFAGSEDAGLYHSVHIAATGVRGLIGPPLGYLIMSLWSMEATLWTSALTWGAASAAMCAVRAWDGRAVRAGAPLPP